MRRTLVALFLAVALAANSQTFLLTGTVRDKLTSAQMMGAEIRLFDMRDSLIAQGEAHDRAWDGRRQAMIESSRFYLGFDKSEIKRLGQFKLRIVAEEHDTLFHVVDLRDAGRRELKRDLGTFYLTKQRTVSLEEVTVTATKVKIYHRGDTLVFNADAFQLAEGSMLDELIRQLPGVELKDGGEIFVNGKKVESLLLNGKNFFRGDNQLMLDNLGAYTVKSVEVYKKQTERARFLGLDGEEDKRLTMDVKMKKEYIGGLTGNAEAGAGTENRYLARLFAMHFNALSQFSMIANVNNLNDSKRPTKGNSWDPAHRPQGTMQYREVAANYSTENEELTRSANGSVTLNTDSHLLENETNTVDFLQTTTTLNNSLAKSRLRRFTMSTDHEMMWQNDWLSIQMRPQMRYSRGKTDSEGSSATRNEETLEQVNRLLSATYGSNNQLNIGGDVNATLKIPKTSDALDLTAKISHDNDRDEEFARSMIVYGDQNLRPDARSSRYRTQPNHDTSGSLGATYTAQLSDRLSMTMTYGYDFRRATKDSKYYLGQIVSENSGDYTMENLLSVERCFDPNNSNTSRQTRSAHNLQPKLKWNPAQNIELNILTAFVLERRNMEYSQNGKSQSVEHNENTLDRAQISIYWSRPRDGKYSEASLKYSCQRQAPPLKDMIDVDDTRDPLSRYVANPGLKSGREHELYARYNFSSLGGKFAIGSTLNFKVSENAFTPCQTYDTATGTRTYQTVNVSGARMLRAQVAGYWEAAEWLTINPQFNYHLRKGFSMIGENSLAPRRFAMDNETFRPSLSLTIKPSKKLRITMMHNIAWTGNRSDNPAAEDINYVTQRHEAAANLQLPWNLSLNTSMTLYKESGMRDERMNITEWIWNGRLTKKMLRGKLLASITTYDLLHEIQEVRYQVNAYSRIESFTNTIPRYVLMHLQYRLDIKPKRRLAETIKYY